MQRGTSVKSSRLPEEFDTVKNRMTTRKTKRIIFYNYNDNRIQRCTSAKCGKEQNDSNNSNNDDNNDDRMQRSTSVQSSRPPKEFDMINKRMTITVTTTIMMTTECMVVHQSRAANLPRKSISKRLHDRSKTRLIPFGASHTTLRLRHSILCGIWVRSPAMVKMHLHDQTETGMHKRTNPPRQRDDAARSGSRPA